MRWGISSYAIHEPYADAFAPSSPALLAGRRPSDSGPDGFFTYAQSQCGVFELLGRRARGEDRGALLRSDERSAITIRRISHQGARSENPL